MPVGVVETTDLAEVVNLAFESEKVATSLVLSVVVDFFLLFGC
jgi:hypothetical protein